MPISCVRYGLGKILMPTKSKMAISSDVMSRLALSGTLLTVWKNGN